MRSMYEVRRREPLDADVNVGGASVRPGMSRFFPVGAPLPTNAAIVSLGQQRAHARDRRVANVDAMFGI
jgi:hypothetical protein